MDKAIATQGELGVFQDSLNRMASNLAFHVNETPQPPALPNPIGSSLSLAHGIDMVVGFVDAYGNDLRVYADTYGDRVSDNFSSGKANFVRFVVNGVPYYAPLQDSALAGQDPSTGALVSTDVTQGSPSSCALITDYVTVEAQTAENIDSLLREHMNVGAASAHVPLKVTPTLVYDSAGHVLNTHLISLQYGGVVFSIPVSTRIGGPFQPIRSVILSGPSSIVIPDGGSNICDLLIKANVVGGTLPVTYLFEYLDNVTWKPLSATGSPVTAVYPIAGWNTGFSATTSASSPIMEIVSVNPAVNTTQTTQFRVTVTSPGGTATSPVFPFSATDYTGNWIIMETLAHRCFTAAEKLSLYKLRRWALRHHPEPTTWYLGSQGKELVRRTREAGFDFKTLMPTVDKLLGPGNYQERYAVFYALVIDLLKRYWSDCQHPLAVKLTGSAVPQTA